MKASEIRPCDLCRSPLMAGGHITFHRIRFERFGVDVRAVRERHGLATLMGSAALAEVFAPSSEVAVRLGEPDELIICETCAMESHLPMRLAEIAAKSAEARRQAAERRAAAKG